MTPERWQEVKTALHRVMQLEPEGRSTYLKQIADTDPDLRLQLDSLLASDDRAGSSFLNTPVFQTGGLFDLGVSATMVGRRIGPYEIVEQIGAGGMGEVYKAFRADDEYRKQAAIKLIRAGQDSEFVVTRFRNERQILATLEHPNIARLLDGGTTDDDNPYFVMELIEGEPIDEYCEGHNLAVRERLRLFLQVCSAVQYAHQRLVIHRDIKPGNILITPEGVPKLLDFGIAKILASDGAIDASERTVTALRLLTPGYASPEQVGGGTVTTASDVYSLGVVLYELLTGRSPYRAVTGAPHELAQAICGEQPEKPSVVVRQSNREPAKSVEPPDHRNRKPAEGSAEKLSKKLRGDLDNIVLMALRKEPQRRYASAEQMAADIQRHLDNLPVAARQDSFGYRASKFVVRHKAGVAAAALVAISLVAGLTVALYEARLARQQQSRAEKRFNDVRQLANSLLFDIHDAIRDLPGSTPARKILVDRALQYLDSLTGESGNDASLQRELATAYERVGMVQGHYLQASLGDTAGSLRSYQKAAAIRERLLAAHPSDVADTLALAHCLTGVANQLVATGDGEHAMATIKKVLTMVESLNQSKPNDLKIMSELSWDYSMAHSISDPSNEYGAKALTVDELWLKLDPDNEAARHAYAVDLGARGDRYHDQQLYQQALADYQKALDINLQVYRRNPTPRWEQSVAHAYHNIGALYETLGNHKLAAEARLKVIEIYERAASADPKNVDLRSHLGVAYANEGISFAKAGNQAKSIELMNRSVETLRSVVAMDPNNVERRIRLANLYFALAETYRNFHKSADALQNYEKSRVLFEARRILDPSNSYLSLKVAGCWQFMGVTELSAGNLKMAKEDFRRAVALAEPFFLATPMDLQAAYAVADSYSGLGDAESAEAAQSPAEADRHWRSARSAYQHSLSAWKKIEHPKPSSPWTYDAGDPKKVGANLVRCEKALQARSNP
ncbi:MAG TPA: protein kinase [Candidatus Angelobacter sp.]|nr:protein kinase [Candidatus Angelobacter sp.]